MTLIGREKKTGSIVETRIKNRSYFFSLSAIFLGVLMLTTFGHWYFKFFFTRFRLQKAIKTLCCRALKEPTNMIDRMQPPKYCCELFLLSFMMSMKFVSWCLVSIIPFPLFTHRHCHYVNKSVALPTVPRLCCRGWTIHFNTACMLCLNVSESRSILSAFSTKFLVYFRCCILYFHKDLLTMASSFSA